MKKIFLILILSGLISPFSALAADEVIKIDNPINATSFETIVDNLVDFIFKMAIVIAPIMIVVAGFLFITAGGDPKQIGRARSLLIWTAVGFLIILLSKGILAIINQILGVQGG